MLAEVLLVLSGHPSSFFEPSSSTSTSLSSLKVSSKLEDYLHPGEVSTLNLLADLAHRYTNIRSWATRIQQAGRDGTLRQSYKGKKKETIANSPHQYLSTLAHSILEVLKEWEALIMDLESKILALDPGMVQDELGYVPLSVLVAAVSPWQAPMSALAALVDQLSSGKGMAPGRLMRMLRDQIDNGNPKIRGVFTALSGSLDRLFLTHLCIFILDGMTASSSNPIQPSLGLDTGVDPLAPTHRVYALNEELLPPGLPGKTKESILYVGRVAATLRSKDKALPRETVRDLRMEIMAIQSLDHEELDHVVARARAEVGEWLWKNVLTGQQVTEAIEAFGAYFLTRNGEFALSTIREIHRVRLDKLTSVDPRSSSSVIREKDLNHALLRASVGTAAENDKALDKLRFKLETGPVRPTFTNTTSPSRPLQSDGGGHNNNSKMYIEDTSTRDLFSSFLLGSSIALETTISWPLDLFMTGPARTAYTDIHTLLFALRDIHLRISICWASLSASQRRRRKWTGTTEGGNAEEAENRTKLARTAWGTVRIMLFFMDQLLGHFMTDIIEVQHQHLLDELEDISIGQRSTSATGSMHGSMHRPESTRSLGRATASGTVKSSRSVASIGAETVQPKRPPTPTQPEYLDFLTLRAMHTRHLAFLRLGLLLSDRGTAVVIRDIMDVCVRFTGLVERWGGDVLPELLLEGSSGEHVGELLAQRTREISEINEASRIDHITEYNADAPEQALRDQILTFFQALLFTQNPSSNAADTSTAPGASMSRTARAAHIIQSSRLITSRQVSFTKPSISLKTGAKAQISDRSTRSAEAEALMARHVEQLLLRLDFNGVLTDWLDAEVDVNKTEILAEGGIQ